MWQGVSKLYNRDAGFMGTVSINSVCEDYPCVGLALSSLCTLWVPGSQPACVLMGIKILCQCSSLKERSRFLPGTRLLLSSTAHGIAWGSAATTSQGIYCKDLGSAKPIGNCFQIDLAMPVAPVWSYTQDSVASLPVQYTTHTPSKYLPLGLFYLDLYSVLVLYVSHC